MTAIIAKKVVSDLEEVIWIIFKHGEFATPLMVLMDTEAKTLAEQLLEKERRILDDIPSALRIAIENRDSVQHALDEWIHDEKSEEASDINNGGYREQLFYLRCSGLSWNDIMKKLEIEIFWPKEGEDGG